MSALEILLWLGILGVIVWAIIKLIRSERWNK